MNLDFIAKPMGWLMRLFYNIISPLDNSVISAYALAIIFATIGIKCILLPLTLKQTKSMKVMQDLSPKLKELQDKYSKDPQTLQRKQMELYKEAKYNPFSGCLPLLIQFPLIIAFFWVIKDPGFAFKDMGNYYTLAELAKQLGLNLTDINASLKAAGDGTIKTLEALINYANTANVSKDLITEVSKAILINSDKYWIWTTDISRSFFWIKDLSFAAKSILPGTNVINGLNMGISLPLIGQAVPILGAISAYTTYLTSKMTSNTQAMGMNDQAKASNDMMMKIMPIVIFITALNFSSGLALYWVVSNVFQLVQQWLILRSSKPVKEE